MWKRRTDDVPHAVMTDHYIQRRKPASFPTAQFPVPTAERPYYFPDQKPVTLYYQNGMNASKAGDYAAAIRWFEQAIQQGDEPAAARRELAASLLLSGNLNRAVAEGEKLPADPMALTNLGNAYLQLGRLDDAKRVLEKASDEPRANNLLGLALLKTGEPSRAESAFRNALNLQPDLAEANNNLGNLLAGRHDYSQAAWYFRKALTSNPAYVEALHSYGLVLALTHDYRHAQVQLEKALHLAPGSVEIRSDLDDVRRSIR